MWTRGTLGALRRVTGALACIAALGPAAAQERSSPSVDLALVLAVDISDSIDPAQYQLQMNGIAQAFEDQDVQNAILSGLHGSIIVALVEWSDVPRMSIGWTAIASPVQAIDFADKVRQLPRLAGKFTCMASALHYIEDRVLPLQPLVAERRIVDVSGDGEENCNPEQPVDAVRSALVGEAVTINGLAIEGAGSPGALEAWYRDHVIGGPFSFVLTAEGFEDFPRAIRRKFLVEISFALAHAKREAR
jgi:hypothetical protein